MKTFLLLSLAGLVLVCGCDRQTRANTERIEALSRQLIQLQRAQAQQLAVFQTQLNALAPALAQTNSYFYTKSYENSLFFHTNTLYLLLNISKSIQAQLNAADSDRMAEHLLERQNQTNLMDRVFFSAAQITTALADRTKQLQDEFNAEIRRMNANLGAGLTNQIRSLVPDKAELARRARLEADLAQLQRDLDAIKARLGIPNTPASQP